MRATVYHAPGDVRVEDVDGVPLRMVDRRLR